LEKKAESSVRQVREASGGQEARKVDEVGEARREEKQKLEKETSDIVQVAKESGTNSLAKADSDGDQHIQKSHVEEPSPQVIDKNTQQEKESDVLEAKNLNLNLKDDQTKPSAKSDENSTDEAQSTNEQSSLTKPPLESDRPPSQRSILTTLMIPHEPIPSEAKPTDLSSNSASPAPSPVTPAFPPPGAASSSSSLPEQRKPKDSTEDAMEGSPNRSSSPQKSKIPKPKQKPKRSQASVSHSPPPRKLLSRATTTTSTSTMESGQVDWADGAAEDVADVKSGEDRGRKSET